MNLNTYFSYWAELYKEDMMNNIMPFWMKYGLDTQNGGIYSQNHTTSHHASEDLFYKIRLVFFQNA